MPPLNARSEPRKHSEEGNRIAGAADVNRREALKYIASGLTFSLAGCSPPPQEIVPYVDMPERLVAGEPQYYATALPLAGYARGMLVEAIDGRPIKVAGNPRHPASLGSTDVFAESEILSLYQPDRSKAVRGPAPVTTWNAFLGPLQERLEALREADGAGLRLVTGRVTSPTLKRQMAALLERHPQARWHAYEPAEGDLAVAPASAEMGAPLDEVDVIVALDADPLGAGPHQIVNGRRFAARRKPPSDGTVSRLYVLESTRTLTGANADHRLALAPAEIDAFARELVARTSGTGAAEGASQLSEPARRLLEAVVGDVGEAGERALLIAGDTLPPQTQQAVRTANRQRRGLPAASRQNEQEPGLTPLEDLWRALEGGDVTDLAVLDCNPAYDFPDPAIAEAIRTVAFSFHAGLYENETSTLCRWHLPLSHILESWSDLAAADGTVSIVQPLIRPLYATRSVHEIVSMLSDDVMTNGYEIVRETWRRDRSAEAFEGWWRDALLAGVVEGGPATAGAPAPAPSESASAVRETPEPREEAPESGGFAAVIRPDPTIYDGRFSNNAWLQECPKPISKHAWSNVVALSPRDAERLRVGNGDVVSVASPEGSFEGPVYVDKAQAAGVVGLTLGYGRTIGGKIGTGLGYNARVLSPRHITARVPGVTVEPAGGQNIVPSTQEHFRLEGEFERLMPQVTAETGYAIEEERPEPGESFLHPERQTDGYEWAMVIDNAACIGCNACVIACQSENNIPVVGPEEVANKRIMHWLRIDRYEVDEGPSSVTGFEPVPCMHCEKAPCEPVCPVEASVHDVEGLNNQVYNRCVGTRFCQSNCPYKVRRFNWFAYASGQEYENLGEEPMPAHYNPDVTVRARGVMEKCTYCVQRISRARRKAKLRDEPIGDGDVMTACQQACPTRAISFGNLLDGNSEVTRLREDPRHFVLLRELGTRPRTTYLARIRNINPDMTEET